MKKDLQGGKRLGIMDGFKLWTTSQVARYLYMRGYLSEYVDVDALTGVYNRNYFERHLGRIVSLAKRTATDLTVVMIDVDDLKKRNDSNGHAAGDLLIKHMAHIFLSSVRESDWVIRMGGDEFLIVLWDCRLDGAEKLMIRITKQANERGIEFSYGLEEVRKGTNAKKRIAEADKKMYEMKQSRKNK